MAKDKQQKKKEREKRVAKKKLLEAAKRRENNQEDDQSKSKGPRAKQVMTQGVKSKPQAAPQKPVGLPRRTGG